MIAMLLACKLPLEEITPEPTWAADCEAWDCPGATGLEWGEAWAVCRWDCTTWEGEPGVDLEVRLEADDGCWDTVSVWVENVDCTWASY